MNILQKAFSISLALTLTTGVAIAQAESAAPAPVSEKVSYTNEQLAKYVAVTMEMEKMQKETMSKVNAIGKEAGLTEETLKAMGMAKMTGGDLSEFSDEQKAAFEKVEAETMKMQQGVMTQAMGIISKAGLDMMTFQAITMDSQNDPSLKDKIEKITAQQAKSE